MINDPVMLKLAEDRFWLSIADIRRGADVSGNDHCILPRPN